MNAVQICICAGILILGFLAGTIFGIVRFGGDPPVGTLKIRYGEPEEDPYIFLELWEGTGDVSKMNSINLLVAVTKDTRN